jgi:AcrR family transcriptional regulator
MGEVLKPPTKRETNRLARSKLFIDTAMSIVTNEGFDALTMARLASDLDAAIGAVYRYFPSKGALVAEVQREAIERLTSSYLLGRERSDRFFADAALSGEELAVARLVYFGRFLCRTSVDYPQEFQLLQMLISDYRILLPLEEGMRVLPSALHLLGRAYDCIEAAMAVGAVSDADSMKRVVVFAASVTGVLVLSRLDRYDADLFDGVALAHLLMCDLFVGWGASADVVAKTMTLVDQLGEVAPLAPPIAPVPAAV